MRLQDGPIDQRIWREPGSAHHSGGEGALPERPDDAPVFASVMICTRDRAKSLARTLESLVLAAAQTDERWELIVVDNGSSDETPATLAGFAGRLPLRLVSQPIPGVSNARNAAVAAMRGGYALWTDDDVVVDPQWLASWFRAFRSHPDHAVFGGRTGPRFEEPRQEWFVNAQVQLGSLLAVRDADWAEVTHDQMPWGLNFAVRAAEQRRHAYDPDLGVAPGRRTGGEEVAVIAAILAEGGTGTWVWDAKVFHMIPAERQSARYIVTFYSAHGFSSPIYASTKWRAIAKAAYRMLADARRVVRPVRRGTDPGSQG